MAMEGVAYLVDVTTTATLAAITRLLKSTQRKTATRLSQTLNLPALDSYFIENNARPGWVSDGLLTQYYNGQDLCILKKKAKVCKVRTALPPRLSALSAARQPAQSRFGSALPLATLSLSPLGHSDTSQRLERQHKVDFTDLPSATHEALMHVEANKTALDLALLTLVKALLGLRTYSAQRRQELTAAREVGKQMWLSRLEAGACLPLATPEAAP
jgi:hypothetical protein